jgi:UDP-N-acetylmuramoyl-L-alanyl-D-glutamate--2,6-diaminopimelate ligase
MTSTNGQCDLSSGGLSIKCLLDVLATFEPVLSGAADARVLGVQQDSRRIEPGDLFVARSGASANGRQFVQAAIDNGAAAVLVDSNIGELPSLSVPVIYVSQARRALAYAAEAVHGYPSRQLGLVGITGTNGKTTTVALVERGLSVVGARPARLGTTGFAFGESEQESNLTTPEADQITRLIAQVVRQRGTHFIMEASSHALDQGRVDALRFEVAAFSNLTQDHLDHHGTMTAYEAAKQRLFTDLAPTKAVINVDDPAGERFARVARAQQLVRVGRSSDCDVQPVDVVLNANGMSGEIRVDDRRVKLQTRLVGDHNLENILLALGILHALGVEMQSAIRAFAGDFGVPGRLERCDSSIDDIVVLVDYAHTPDALERALQAVKRFAKGSVHCVFGCGGDRDPKKRPLMGLAVGKWADRATVTNDNPRTESPDSIALAIEPGLRQTDIQYNIELDRAVAIRVAILAAKGGDVVVIAGKGHETYQIVGTAKRPFDDRAQAREALGVRRGDPSGRKGGL